MPLDNTEPPASRAFSLHRAVFWLSLMAVLASLAAHAVAEGRCFTENGVGFVKEFESACTFYPPERSPDHIKREMKKYLGIPYRWGGTSTRGMDCSGLTKEVYAKIFGVELPHNSVQQSRLPSMEEVPPTRDELQLGDLLFFGPRKKKINHVGIYLSDGKFLHSCRSAGVTISSLNKAYWKRRLITSKRLKGAEPNPTLDAYPFSMSYWAATPALLDPFDDSAPSLEVGYRRTLLDFANVGLDTFMSMTASPDAFGQNSGDADWWGLNRLDRGLAFEPRRGFRLFADVNLAEWLRITPSFTQTSGFAFQPENEDSFQTLGLETHLSVPNSRWSFALSARADNHEDPSGLTADGSGDWDTVDITFGLQYRYSDSLDFSVIGTRQPATLRNADSSDGQETPGASNFAFKVNLAF